MDIKDMRCLVAIAQMKNVTRAAEKLYMTQPALSRTIANLERELGVELLDHRARPVVLTAAGEVFYEKARRILRIEESLRSDIARMKEGLNLSLSMEYGNAGQMPLVAKALRRFKKLYPSVSISVHRQYNALAVQDLKTGECELCVVNLPEVEGDHELIVERLCPESLYAFMPKGHVLAEKDALCPADLLEAKLCIFERFASPHMFDRIMDFLRADGVDCQNIAQAPDTSTFSLMLIAYGMVGIMPKHTMVFGSADIRSIPIAGIDNLDIVAVWKRDQHNPSIQAFVDILKGTLDQYQK